MEGDKGKCSKVYGESTSIVRNVEELKRNIEAKCLVHSPSLRSCCIFKVPEVIRRHSEQAMNLTLSPSDPSTTARKNSSSLKM
ncbi:unnamed protein product [Prunus armeniaca]